MKRAEWVKQAASAGAEFSIRRKNPWLHNTINLAMVGLLFGAMGGVLVMVADWPFYLAAVGGGLMVSWLVLCLGSFLLHEASHAMFLTCADQERARRINTAVGRLGGILLNTDYITFWESGHLFHHVHAMEPGDKMLPRTMGGRFLLHTLLKIVLIPGYAAVRNPERILRPPDPRFFKLAAIWGTLITVCLTFLTWKSALAFLAGMSMVDAVVVLRQAQEHPLGSELEADPYLRGHTLVGWIAWVVAPFNQNYHLEHHLNFQVPWYSAPAYHRRIKGIVPPEIWPYLVKSGLRGFWANVTGTAPMPPLELEARLAV